MWNWLAKNKEWLFSGVGVTAFVGVWWFFRKLLISRSDPLPALVNQVTQTPAITVSPIFNLSQELRSPEELKQEPPAHCARSGCSASQPEGGSNQDREDLFAG